MGLDTVLVVVCVVVGALLGFSVSCGGVICVPDVVVVVSLWYAGVIPSSVISGFRAFWGVGCWWLGVVYGLFVSCTWCFDCVCLWFDFRELEFLRFLRWVGVLIVVF